MLRTLATVCVVLLGVGLMLAGYELLASGMGLSGIFALPYALWRDLSPNSIAALTAHERWIAVGLACFIGAALLIYRTPKHWKYW